MSLGASSSAGGLAADFSSRIARLMAYIVLCMVLMTLDYRGFWVERIRTGATFLVEPIWLAVEAPAAVSRSVARRWENRSELLTERDLLALSLDQSRAKLLRLNELQRENDRLRALLGATATIDRNFQAVELRDLDLNPYSHRLLINRGASDGLQVGQVVMDASGLVGQVDSVLVHTASVILLSDPDHALPVEIERSRLRTIAYGSGRNDEIRLNDLPMNADIQVGDVLLSSGLGGRFQPGLPVADVVEVERVPGQAFASARAELRARMQGARHLLVVTDPSPPAVASDANQRVDDGDSDVVSDAAPDVVQDADAR